MTPEDYRWTEFSIMFYYPAPVRTVYSSWATKAGLESFFIDVVDISDESGAARESSELIHRGDSFVWNWRHSASLSGHFYEAELDTSVAFSFGTMRCRVSFDQVDSVTTCLTLKQTEISEDVRGKVMGHLNCYVCWTFFLTNLKSVLVTGTDLRETDPQRANSMAVMFTPNEASL